MIELAQAVDRSAAQPTKWVAYELVRYHPSAFQAVREDEIEAFAHRVASWYATDALGTILAGPLWARGRLPGVLVDRWSRSENRWLRRLALVATVGHNAHRPDAGRTFAVCRALAADRDDMVVKAVSWALRYLSQKERAAVVDFMAECGAQFAIRVRREVGTKLATGRKTVARAGRCAQPASEPGA